MPLSTICCLLDQLAVHIKDRRVLNLMGNICGEHGAGRIILGL